MDVLINNAGCIMNYKERVTCPSNPDWEQTIAVNSIAPILLTDLLIDSLKETASAKVIHQHQLYFTHGGI